MTLINSLVSVIIPCHNRIGPLRECLQSVAGQTHSAIEVIVVDDASDEDIRAVVDAVAWPEGFTVHYIRSDENVGPGASRELGRQRASGDFIAYLDSDDLWDAQMIEKSVAKLQADPEAGMCYCTTRYFESLPLQHDLPIRERSDQPYREFFPVIFESGARPWGTGSCVWRRAATDTIGPWFHGWAFEDLEYEVRAGCEKIWIAHVPETLCFVRRSENEERLSGRKLCQYSPERISTHILIAGHLEQASLLKNDEIHRVLLQRMFRYFVAGYFCPDRKPALLCLEFLVEYGHFSVRFVAYLVRLMDRYLPYWASCRIVYRIRHLHRLIM